MGINYRLLIAKTAPSCVLRRAVRKNKGKVIVMNDTRVLLEFVYKNAEMGRKTIQPLSEMTDDEKRQMKRRYVIDSRVLEAAANRPQRKLSPEEKRLLREQIMAVHIEIRRGVPFDCLDPVDCRTGYDRLKQAQDAARRRAATPRSSEIP